MALPHAVGIVDFIKAQSGNAQQNAEIWEKLFLPESPRDILRGKLPDKHFGPRLRSH